MKDFYISKQDSYSRNCPTCQRVINYSCYSSWHLSNKNNSDCRWCASKKMANTPEFKEKSRKNYKKYLGKIDKSGKNNPFYGKIHTKETREKMRRASVGRKLPKGVGFQKGCKGNKIPVYDCWLKKYGKKEADRRDKIRKEKWSIASKGKNNPMYGKPSPQGSGNGWSGWYKNYYFRSLLELSYIVNYIEKNSLSFVNAEIKKYKIPYIDPLGNKRNYFADFIVNNTMIECKPKKLQNSPLVLCKKKAAIEFCKNNNLVYNMLEPKKIKFEKIKQLYEDGFIKWIPRYKEKYEKLIRKKTNN